MSTFEALPDWIKLLGGVIGILTTVVVVTVYLTRLKLEGSRRLQEAQAQIEQQRTTIGALEASSQALSQSVTLLREGREAAAAVLAEVTRLMTEGRHMVLATAESVLIPDPYAPDTLVFLAVQGTAARQIKHLRVPVSGSAAGRVFNSGRAAIYTADSAQTRFTETDTKAAFQSNSILTLPLTSVGRAVGVLQYVNRSDGGSFSQQDADALAAVCDEIALRVERLVRDLGALKVLGIAQQAESSEGTFMFLDLTRSSELFTMLSPAEVLSLLNEYYDRVISRALREGAMLDRLLGDGMLLRFNVPRRVPQHAAVAVRCAYALQAEFAEIRAEWLRIGRPVASLQHRIGIASGPVIAGQMGHPQFLSYTVIGQPVNAAARLCEAARATPNGIAISEDTYTAAVAELGGLFEFRRLEGASPGHSVQLRESGAKLAAEGGSP